MKINDLLIEKRPQIINRWFDLIIETYPEETSSFLKNFKAKLNNPAGSIIREGIEGLFDQLISDAGIDKAAPLLDSIIRVRAIQDFKPSQAVSFTGILKKVLREELNNDILKHQLFEEMLEFDLKIDGLTDLAFDIYMECREKLFTIRAKEIKDMTYRLVQRANRTGAVQRNNHGS
jgi:hypothetical protein